MTVRLTCKELVEIVTDYLEGKLPPEDQARFEMHLSGCAGCSAYLAQMRQIITLAGRLSEDAIPEGTRAELLALFRDWKKNPQA